MSLLIWNALLQLILATRFSSCASVDWTVMFWISLDLNYFFLEDPWLRTDFLVYSGFQDVVNFPWLLIVPGGGWGVEILFWKSAHTNHPVVHTTCCPISVPSGHCRHEVKWLQREADNGFLGRFKLLKCKPASTGHRVSCSFIPKLKDWNIPKVRRRRWVYQLFIESVRNGEVGVSNGEVGVSVSNMYWVCVMV